MAGPREGRLWLGGMLVASLPVLGALAGETPEDTESENPVPSMLVTYLDKTLTKHS